jgi:rod shape-determining protein MreB
MTVSIRKVQETNHETSRKTDYPSLHEIIKIEDEVRTALKSIKNKKERFREWTKSLGDSPKIEAMFIDFDARITQLSAKLEYLEKIRTQVARGEILPHEIPLYVARATNDFVRPAAQEFVTREPEFNTQEVIARTDESSKQEHHQEMAPVSSTSQEPFAEILPEVATPQPVSVGVVLPNENQVLEFLSNPSDTAEKTPTEPTKTEFPASDPFIGVNASELFETILEEQPTDEEKFTFVIEDAGIAVPAPPEREAGAARTETTEIIVAPETPCTTVVSEIQETASGVAPVELSEARPEPDEGVTEETGPESAEVPVAPVGSEPTVVAPVELSEARPEPDEGGAEKTGPESDEVPVAPVGSEPTAVAPAELSEARAEPDEGVTEKTGPESDEVPVAPVGSEPTAVAPAELSEVRLEPDEGVAEETGLESAGVPESASAVLPEKLNAESVVIPFAEPMARGIQIQPEVAEKAIDSIFSRNMVLKSRNKVIKENPSEIDEPASQTIDARAPAEEIPVQPGARSWKKVGHSIPEAELTQLIEETPAVENREAASSATVHTRVTPATDPQAAGEKFSKYIRPKLPETVLKKQYHHYLAEKNPSAFAGEADLVDLELTSFEDDEKNATDGKRESKFSVKNIKSRFSLRRFKKSKEDKPTMETGKAATPKDTKVEAKAKEEVSVEKAIPETVKTEVAEDKSVLYLGIDLGTSETTIAASNGIVATVLSVMGKPKDFISQKLLKAEKLFGLDALRNKLAVTLFRPMEKGVIKDTEADLEAARELVKYVISLANPEKYEKVYAVIGAPARSSFANQQALVDAAREVVDAVMIVSEPFAVAYGEGKIYNSLVIDIGAGTTDICCLKGSMPEEEDQFTLLKAGDNIDNYLVDLILAKFEGAQVTKDLAKKFKEEYSFVIEPDRNAVVEITVQGKPTKIDITKDIRESCESIIPELITCTKNIIANFNPEFQSELKENIMLAGGGSLIKNLGQYIERQLRALGTVKVTLVPNPIEAGAKGALALAKDLTDEYWRAL